jgi:predicted metal-dependent hydrolase
VKVLRGQLVVQSHKPRQSEVTKDLVEQWYRERAQAKLRERLSHCLKRFSRPEKVQPTSVVVMQMRQRWGSMTPTGKLILNKDLVQASVDAIDYVITHELCHRQHGHHGRSFMDLLERVMPDWERRKLKLERQLA